MLTTPTVARDRDRMSDDEEAVMDAEVPDEYSEGSGNPDEDWDGCDDEEEDDTSKGVSQVEGGVEAAWLCQVLRSTQGIHAVPHQDHRCDNCPGNRHP